MIHFSYKGGRGCCIHIDVLKRRVGLGYRKTDLDILRLLVICDLILEKPTISIEATMVLL